MQIKLNSIVPKSSLQKAFLTSFFFIFLAISLSFSQLPGLSSEPASKQQKQQPFSSMNQTSSPPASASLAPDNSVASPPSPSASTSNPSNDKSKPESEPARLYREAVIELEKKNYTGSLSKIDEAEKLTPNDSNLENLRGAVYTHQRDFPKAIEAFTKAVDFNKSSFSARFNLCEVLFLDKMYPEAESHFQELYKDNPKNELVLYKLFLCDLAQDKRDDAKKILTGLSFGDDFPTYYYAHAAWEFKNNNSKEAYGWIGSANNIYPPQLNALYSDSLVELGWIPREGPQTQVISAVTAGAKK